MYITTNHKLTSSIIHNKFLKRYSSMFFNNSNNDDPYGDLRRREEYERQQKINMARTGGNLLVNILGYWFVWIFSFSFSATLLENIVGLDTGVTMLISFILSLVIFKVSYVKAHPYKSFLVICFVFGLFIIASSWEFLRTNISSKEDIASLHIF